MRQGSEPCRARRAAQVAKSADDHAGESKATTPAVTGSQSQVLPARSLALYRARRLPYLTAFFFMR